jgi:hypothetical protein
MNFLLLLILYLKAKWIHYHQPLTTLLKFVKPIVLCLTGKAGTGKTTLLKKIIRNINVICCRSSWNCGLKCGWRYNSFVNLLPFGGFVSLILFSKMIFQITLNLKIKRTSSDHENERHQTKSVIQNVLLIIDEVSMLRPDVLQMQWIFCLTIAFESGYLWRCSSAFFIGDLLQLPPVVSEEEWHVLRNYYGGKFFFHTWYNRTRRCT